MAAEPFCNQHALSSGRAVLQSAHIVPGRASHGQFLQTQKKIATVHNRNTTMLTFDVHLLASKPEGSREEHQLDEVVTFEEPELSPLSRLRGRLIFMKLPHELNVQLHELSLDVEVACSRCLKRFPYTIEIESAECEFFIDVPESQSGTDEDYFLVDTKYWTISLHEMVRQELLLHFPDVPVCSESCKGLCSECGVNLNENTCPHQ